MGKGKLLRLLGKSQNVDIPFLVGAFIFQSVVDPPCIVLLPSITRNIPLHTNLCCIWHCRLNFHLGQIHVKDQFVWDLADPDANPEAFAEVMCKDLELPRQFVPEIACRIREQIIELKKNGPSG